MYFRIVLSTILPTASKTVAPSRHMIANLEKKNILNMLSCTQSTCSRSGCVPRSLKKSLFSNFCNTYYHVWEGKRWVWGIRRPVFAQIMVQTSPNLPLNKAPKYNHFRSLHHKNALPSHYDAPAKKKKPSPNQKLLWGLAWVNVSK